jgi:hypothetical protein
VASRFFHAALHGHDTAAVSPKNVGHHTRATATEQIWQGGGRIRT